MKNTTLYVENFPAELRRDGRIAALREGVTWREFLIRAVRARIAATASPGGGGQTPEPPGWDGGPVGHSGPNTLHPQVAPGSGPRGAR